MGKELGHNPEKDFVQRGLLSDLDVKLDGFKWVLWDYGGKLKRGQPPALALTCSATSLEDSTISEELHWSAGSSKDIKPIDDGAAIEAQRKEVGGLSNSCNAFHLFQSLLDAGLNGDVLDERVAAMNGMEIHLLRKKVTRTGGGDVAESSEVAICTQLLRAPGEEKRAASKPGGGKKDTKGAAKKDDKADKPGGGTSDADLLALATKLVETVLDAEDDNETTTDKLPALVLRAAIGEGASKEARAALKKQIGDEDFLNQIEGVVVANGIVAKV